MWIAFDNDQVTILAVHKEMKIAWQQAKDKGYDPIMERMPDDPNMVYIPTFFEVQLSDL